MASNIEQVCGILKGTHMLGSDGLADYHAAKAFMNSNRKGTIDRRFDAMRLAVKNYRVIVSRRDSAIRLFNPETKAELILD